MKFENFPKISRFRVIKIWKRKVPVDNSLENGKIFLKFLKFHFWNVHFWVKFFEKRNIFLGDELLKDYVPEFICDEFPDFSRTLKTHGITLSNTNR